MRPSRRAWLAAAGAGALAAMAGPALAEPPAIPDPPPGKALVVFYRTWAYPGGALSFTVHEGPADVGLLSPGTYFTALADPGWHTYTVRAERHADMQIDLEADETYYVRFELGTGWLLYQPSLVPTEQWQWLEDAQHGLKLSKLPTR